MNEALCHFRVQDDIIEYRWAPGERRKVSLGWLRSKACSDWQVKQVPNLRCGRKLKVSLIK